MKLGARKPLDGRPHGCTAADGAFAAEAAEAGRPAGGKDANLRLDRRRRPLPVRRRPSLPPDVIARWQQQWDANGPGYELVVDFFAGGGGTSVGLEWAFGRSPDIAVNHDAEAVAMHEANHPATLHLCDDVFHVGSLLDRLIGNRKVGLFWASPDCKHFSKAKGGRPVKRRIRDLAWVVPRFAARYRPRVIMLENVEEFRDWGPLVQKSGADGKPLSDLHGSPVMVPCKQRKGQTFQQWVATLQRLGYRVEWRELRASAYGAPTIRKRLFIIARRDGRPIVWPAETHGPRDSAEVKAGKLLPFRVAADIIDFSLPCPSIFLTPEEARKVGCKRPLAPATMARIAKGVFRYVINAADPFIVPITHTGDTRVHPIDDPLRTITSAHRGEHALVMPHVTKFNRGATGHEVDQPLHTITAAHSETHPGGGSPLGLAAAYLVPRYGEREGQEPRTRPVTEPMPTPVPDGNEASLLTPILARTAHGDTNGKTTRGRGSQEVTEPVPTILATQDAAVVIPHLMTMRNAEKPHTAADEAMHTVTAEGAHPAVVAAFLAQHNSERDDGIKSGREANEPVSTVTAAGGQQGIVTAHLSAFYGEGEGGSDRSASAEEPVRTVTCDPRHAVVAAFLAQHNTDMVGHDAREHVSTIVGKGCTQGVVQAELAVSAGVATLRGTGDDQLMPRPVGAPVGTISAGGGHHAEVRAFLMKYHANGGQHASAKDPAPTVDCNDRIGIVTVHGVEYRIVDIGMRMLTVAERFAAQGFPPTYNLKIKVRARRGHGWVMKPISGEALGRMVGNSVSPPVAQALGAANLPELRIQKLAA